jgi:hypothetical protein
LSFLLPPSNGGLTKRAVVPRGRRGSRSNYDWRPFIAFAAGPVFAIASLCFAQAATKEEVDRCRAIEQRADRVACFNVLKQNKPAKTEGPAPAKAESTPSTKRRDGGSIKAGATATSNVPPQRPDTPTNNAAINDLLGRPICVDSNGLAAVLMAGLLTSDPAQAVLPGCQTIPFDAKVEILERYPGVYPFMRLIRVKVTSRTRPDLTGGFTVEVASSPSEVSSPKAPQ